MVPWPAMSTPSYSVWAARMVRVAVKPRRRDASCCKVLVMNAGVGCLARLPFFSSPTVYSAPSSPFSMARASASVCGSSFLPLSSEARRAVKLLCPTPRVASTFQYSSGLKPSISFSRSSIRRTATLWTRPADRPRRTFRQRNGLSL